MTKVFIWVDDVRKIDWSRIPPDNFCAFHAKSYKEAIYYLETFIKDNKKIIIDLDHDLGGRKSGYDIAKWIVASGYKNLSFRIHSMNPVGVKNMKDILTHYGYYET